VPNIPRKAGLTPDKVTLAAAGLADEIGFGAVTVSAVARRLGVRDASLYSHVRGLPDLRVRIALLAAGELGERIGAAVAGRAGKDAFVAFAGAYRDYALEHPGRYAATQVRIDLSKVADTPALRRNVELTHAMLHAYGLTEPDLTDAGRLVRSAIHGFSTLEATGGFGAPRDVEISWRRALDALHLTLERWPRSGSSATP